MAGAASVGPGGGWRVAGGEQAARQRFGFLRAGPRRFFFWSDFWSERGSPVDCPLSTVHFQRRTRPGTSAPAPPKAADGRELAWSWGRPGTTSGAAAVGMALATRYSGGPGGVGSRSRSWMRQMEVQGSWRCDATGPESPGNGCWCRLLGSPLPECCSSSNWTLRRRVGKGAGPAQQRQGSRGAGRWGHGSPAQRSAWGTRRRTFRAKRAKGALPFPSLPLRGCVMQTLAVPRPPRPEPIPDGQGPDDTPAERGMPFGRRFANGRLVFLSCAVLLLLRRPWTRGPGPAVQ